MNDDHKSYSSCVVFEKNDDRRLSDSDKLLHIFLFEKNYVHFWRSLHTEFKRNKESDSIAERRIEYLYSNIFH